MAGIYIHVPFCGYACSYCDFYFTTHLKFKDQYLKAITKEIELSKSYLQGEPIETIYFGGGTPSKLSPQELDAILLSLAKHHSIVSNPEITLEANPDDINAEIVNDYKSIGVNRFSMGVQTFHQHELDILGRKHTVGQAIKAIDVLRKADLNNFNLDLIYGMPNSTQKSWEYSLNQMLEIEPNHISAYCLTVEPATPLEHLVNKGRVTIPNDEEALNQFNALVNQAQKKGYQHYEISNFAKPDKYSKHNTSYWFGAKYLGLGPSAHSYNGSSRRYNVANTPKYLKALNENSAYYQTETLTIANQFNEYIMTRIRTQWGIDLLEIEDKFGQQFLQHTQQEANKYLIGESLIQEEANIKLTQRGKFLADKIASDLFIAD